MIYRAILLALVVLFCTAQAQPPGFPPGAFIGRGAIDAASGGGGRTCTDGTHSAAFVARTSGLSNAALDAYCVLINGLDTDGLFTLGDQLLVLAAPDATTAALNLLSTSFSASLSGSPTFTANAGYSKSGATSKVDTGFNASSSGTNFTQNENGALVFTLDSWGAGVDSGSAVGYVTNASVVFFIYPHFTDNNTYMAAQTTVAQNQAYSAGGHFIGWRSSTIGNDTTYFFNNTPTAKLFFTPAALVNDNFNLLGDNQVGYRVYNGTIAAWWVGAPINNTQQANLYARLCTYLTTVHGSC